MQQPSDHIFVNVPMLFQAVTAACMMVRKSDFDSVNGFDQSYWNGSEDVDLCFKLTETAKKIVYQPKSVVIHYESKSGEERRKGIKQNNNLLRERWAGKIKPDVIISGNQVRQGPSQTIQPYLQNDESVSVSRSEYINALTCWVQKSIVEPIRSPVKKFRFAIKTCTPTRNDLGWGDTPFANSLAKAIMKLGNSCEVQFKDEWNQADKHIDIVIHLRGLYRYTPKPYNRNILWIINHPERQTIEQINQFDLVFCASRIYLERLRNTTKVPCFYLPQATDQEVFNPSTSCLAKDIDLLFVGNRYYKDRRRKIIQDVLDTGKKYGLYVIGQGWHGFLDNEYYKAEYVEWHKLPQLYSRAKIVLNDHHETMSQFGFVNNRTFDLAALKAFQISNYVQGIEEFGIVTYKSPQDLAKKLDYFLQNERARKEFANLSNKLCQGHTFTNAARRIVDVASKLFNEKNSTKDIQKWCAENAAIDSVEMTDVKIVPRLVLEPMETSQQMQDK
jgi:spore maturation protein CgeB